MSTLFIKFDFLYNVKTANKFIMSTEKNMTTGNITMTTEEELDLYRSLFTTHSNSVIYNLKLKTINGKPVWIDVINVDKSVVMSLDQDEETKAWLVPTKCER
jgi:hypothetical protein